MSKWYPHLHELGEVQVKHGIRISVVNLYTDIRERRWGTALRCPVSLSIVLIRPDFLVAAPLWALLAVPQELSRNHEY